MKTAGHLEKVKRMRVGDKLLEGIVPFYEVRLIFFSRLHHVVFTDMVTLE